MALLEATNVSEKRGTSDSFLNLGAPWLEGFELQLAVPGFELEPTRFAPTKSPAAPWAKHLDRECHGWRVRVTDADLAKPYRLGVELLRAFAARPEFEWRREGEALTWLVETPALLAAVEEGLTVE